MPPNHLFWFLMTAATGLMGFTLFIVLYLTGAPIVAFIYTAGADISGLLVFFYLYVRPIRPYA